MNPGDVAPMIVATVLFVMGGLTLILRGPIGKAIARRFEVNALPADVDVRLQELEARVVELEQERAELAERLDFAERVLGQVREGRVLPR